MPRRGLSYTWKPHGLRLHEATSENTPFERCIRCLSIIKGFLGYRLRRMNPFDDIHTKSRQWSLEDDGIDVIYDADFIDPKDADRLFAILKTQIDWQRAVIQTPGGPKTVPRMISWHADPGLTYSYSGLKHSWQPWTEAMLEIKQALESRLDFAFNGCLANFYENERDSISMHSDDEVDLDAQAPIASVSLGAVREFVLKHKETKARHVIPLEHGSLVVMSGKTQDVSQHGIPKAKRSCGPRINLTFRRMVGRGSGSTAGLG